jgi:hypothetical protein
MKSNCDSYFATAGNGDGYQWLSQYHITACLRPELYETGRLINLSGENTYQGIQGAFLREQIIAASTHMVTGIEYTEENVNKFKDFIRAQEKYPEVFEIFQDNRTPYNNGDNFTNCRWFHMNRYDNASMSMGGGENNAQLGWGGYIQPSWRTTQQLSAVIVPFVYDSAQRDIYYENPDDRLNELSFGCFALKKIGGINYIKVKITEVNGFVNPLFQDILTDPSGSIVEAYRKCGYDMHFSSVGTPWILPYSGHTQDPGASNSQAILTQRGRMYANQGVLDSGQTTYNVDDLDLSQLYMGADSAELAWDGTHFALKNLHTPLNRGNDLRSNVEYATGIGDISSDVNAGDVVYKINPREQYEDWTPTRMPYVAQRILYNNASHIDANSFEVEEFNENLTQWQIYDAPCGVFIEDFNLDENQWFGSFWERLGFSYQQFHSNTNTRLARVTKSNVNDLSIITTNSEVAEGDTKIYYQNFFKAPLYNTMIPRGGTVRSITEGSSPPASTDEVAYVPEIVQKTESISIVADNLPTRMIRGYYTIRSNIIEENPFIGGKKDNTTMPICGIVNKINGAGDFYQQEGSEVSFTITKPMRLASIKCSIHDPDGSYANSNEQNTVLFKVVKQKNFTFNVVQQLIQENKGKMPAL